MIKQRLYGLCLLLLGAASVLPTGDATAALLLIPLGLWLLCSSSYLLQGKKKSAPAAGTVDAPNPKMGALASTPSIAHLEDKCKC